MLLESMELKKNVKRALYDKWPSFSRKSLARGEKGGDVQLLKNKRDLKDKRTKHNKQILFGT